MVYIYRILRKCECMCVVWQAMRGYCIYRTKRKRDYVLLISDYDGMMEEPVDQLAMDNFVFNA